MSQDRPRRKPATRPSSPTSPSLKDPTLLLLRPRKVPAMALALRGSSSGISAGC